MLVVIRSRYWLPAVNVPVPTVITAESFGSTIVAAEIPVIVSLAPAVTSYSVIFPAVVSVVALMLMLKFTERFVLFGGKFVIPGIGNPPTTPGAAEDENVAVADGVKVNAYAAVMLFPATSSMSVVIVNV